MEFNGHLTEQNILGRTSRLRPFDSTRSAQKTAHPKILLFLRVYSLRM